MKSRDLAALPEINRERAEGRCPRLLPSDRDGERSNRSGRRVPLPDIPEEWYEDARADGLKLQKMKFVNLNA